MTLNTEILFTMVCNILILAFGCGIVWAELKAIRKDLARLEEKQDKYNNLQERTRVLEVKVEDHLRGN